MKFYGSSFIKHLAAIGCLMYALASCNVVKDHPSKPFVFDNRVVLRSPDLPKDEKKKLSDNLMNYWDDSLLAQRTQEVFFVSKLRHPPAFDSLNIIRTKKFMDAYLRSQGYYYAGIKSSYKIDSSHKDQKRVTVTMTVSPGKNTLIDSVNFHLDDSTLQRLTEAHKKESLLRTGKPYSAGAISSELDRLVKVYRDSGYFNIGRDNVYALVDTVDASLLDITTDPFEQALKIEAAAKRRRESPTIDVTIMDTLRNNDSSKMKQYYIGNVYYYPEAGNRQLPDSLMKRTDLKATTNNKGDITMYYLQGKFKLRPLREHTFIRKGDLYNETAYFKTLNNFNQIGAWTQIDTRPITRGDTVDMNIFLTPAIKQNITVSLEASRNTGDFITTATTGYLLGLSLNTAYKNRNVWKRAIQSTTAFSNGVELGFGSGEDLLQTFQSSLSQTYSFPRFIMPSFILKALNSDRNKLDNVRTVLSASATYSSRSQYYRLRSLTTNWGYEWKKKNITWQYRPLNIELYSLDTLPLLEAAFITNPYLKTSFNTGSVISQQLSMTTTFPDAGHPNRSNYFRFALEEAGGLLGRIKNLQDQIYQYVKLEGEYRRNVQFRKTSVAMRLMAGVGYNYGNDPKFGHTLPFFKQFFGGGPNSMRGWGLRQIGLGASLLSDTSTTFTDRYGDMQLEANFEYRYPIAHISSMLLAGALFTDIGNVWNVRKDPNNPNSEFSINMLGKEAAIAVGTGLRFDFNYFLIRVDMGIKLKDPARQVNGGWLDVTKFSWRDDEYRSGSPYMDNYAIQLGINLPF